LNPEPLNGYLLPKKQVASGNHESDKGGKFNNLGHPTPRSRTRSSPGVGMHRSDREKIVEKGGYYRYFLFKEGGKEGYQ